MKRPQRQCLVEVRDRPIEVAQPEVNEAPHGIRFFVRPHSYQFVAIGERQLILTLHLVSTCPPPVHVGSSPTRS
jgi:hypothetical protein